MLGPRWRPVRQRRGETHDIQWLSARSWTNRWYPQGIDVGTFKGRSALAISWFRQDRRRTHLASRVTLVDFDRSRHLDIMLAVRDDAGLLQPAPIHAGGLAWIGDRLFVAATRQGIWEFDLSGVRRISGIAARRVSGNPRRSLRDVAVIAERVRVHPVDLRCSFIGRVFDDGGGSPSAFSSASTERIRVAGLASFPSPRRDWIRSAPSCQPLSVCRERCAGERALSFRNQTARAPARCGSAMAHDLRSRQRRCPPGARISRSTPKRRCSGRSASTPGAASCEAFRWSRSKARSPGRSSSKLRT